MREKMKKYRSFLFQFNSPSYRWKDVQFGCSAEELLTAVDEIKEAEANKIEMKHCALKKFRFEMVYIYETESGKWRLIMKIKGKYRNELQTAFRTESKRTYFINLLSRSRARVRAPLRKSCIKYFHNFSLSFMHLCVVSRTLNVSFVQRVKLSSYRTVHSCLSHKHSSLDHTKRHYKSLRCIRNACNLMIDGNQFRKKIT